MSQFPGQPQWGVENLEDIPDMTWFPNDNGDLSVLTNNQNLNKMEFSEEQKANLRAFGMMFLAAVLAIYLMQRIG